MTTDSHSLEAFREKVLYVLSTNVAKAAIILDSRGLVVEWPESENTHL